MADPIKARWPTPPEPPARSEAVVWPVVVAALIALSILGMLINSCEGGRSEGPTRPGFDGARSDIDGCWDRFIAAGRPGDSYEFIQACLAERQTIDSIAEELDGG